MSIMSGIKSSGGGGDLSYIAPEFSSSSTYEKGDSVFYEGVLYKCKTAIDTAGAWDSTKWEETGITEELEAISTGLADITPSGYEVFTESGTFTVPDGVNKVRITAIGSGGSGGGGGGGGLSPSSGNGGAGSDGTNGTNTTIAISGITVLTANGGTGGKKGTGGGCGYVYKSQYQSGSPGSGGAGYARGNNIYILGFGEGGAGGAGGYGKINSSSYAGGAGGASGNGTSGSAGTTGGGSAGGGGGGSGSDGEYFVEELLLVSPASVLSINVDNSIAGGAGGAGGVSGGYNAGTAGTAGADGCGGLCVICWGTFTINVVAEIMNWEFAEV